MWVTGWFAQPVELIAQVAHEAMAVTHDLSASEWLEAAHTACPPFEVLVITLDPLLLHLARDVLRFRTTARRGGGYVGALSVVTRCGRTSVRAIACAKKAVAAAVSRVSLR